MQRISIVHVISGLELGGAERMLSNLVLGMDKSKFNNIVISLSTMGHWGPILAKNEIQVYSLNLRPSILSLARLVQMRDILRQHKPNIIQGWMFHANLISFVLAKYLKINNIFWNIRCSLFDLSHYRFTTKLAFKTGAVLSRLVKVIINNSKASIAQHTASGYRAKKWLYIPNGFDTVKFKPNSVIYREFRIKHKLPDTAIIIAMIARFDPTKDHETFFQAANILSTTHPEVYFVCAGKDINKTNEFLAAMLPIDNRKNQFLLLGQINNVQDILPAMNYLTQTSVCEGFPNIIGEAMSCGVKCFATNVGDTAELMGDTGIIIPTHDPQALSSAWAKQIKEDKQNISKHCAAARSRIINEFSIDKIIEIYEEFYLNCYKPEHI